MSVPVNSSLVGEVVDARYRVVGHLAEGGMASVYLAVDTRLDRDIALKVMHPHLAADEAFVSRFRREARAAARLSHPNVVAVHDQGDDDGRVFLAMEYVPGVTLRELLDTEGPLTARRALQITESIATALSAAHRAGLIHRDIKPENVIIRDDGLVKVADFGLARAVTSDTLTADTDTVLGTVAYLSPEQVARGITGPRSDVYSTALVLFEMLTGGKAFPGDIAINVAYQHVHTGVPNPSSRASGIPAALDELVLRAASIDPDDRPDDAGDFLTELHATHGRLSSDELDRAAVPIGAALNGSRNHPTPVTRHTEVLSPGPDRSSGRHASTMALTTLPADTDETAPVRRRRRWIGPIVVALVLVAAAAGLSWWFLFGPGSPTTVPPMANLTWEQAETALKSADLVGERHDVFDETIPAGTVVSTNPVSGKDVRRGSTVAVSVSKGKERYAVPDLGGMNRQQAESALGAVLLVVGEVSEDFDEKIPKGTIISFTPKTGEQLKRGDAVDLVISKGRQPITVTNFTGKPADEATKALTKAGLKVDADATEFSTTVKKGSVISQDPRSGTLFRGDTVTLVVSKGPEMVTMPNVVGDQAGEARKALEKIRLKVKIERIMGGFFNTVRSQSEEPGTRVPIGSTITLRIV